MSSYQAIAGQFKPRRKPAKRDRMLHSERDKLMELAAKLLKDLGAKLEPGYSAYWRLPTPLGELGISVYDDWLACWFPLVKPALEKMGESLINRFTGKYNCHLFARMTAEQGLESYRQHLAHIWIKAGQPRPECLVVPYEII